MREWRRGEVTRSNRAASADCAIAVASDKIDPHRVGSVFLGRVMPMELKVAR
jgi:hypothetical protein